MNIGKKNESGNNWNSCNWLIQVGGNRLENKIIQENAKIRASKQFISGTVMMNHIFFCAKFYSQQMNILLLFLLTIFLSMNCHLKPEYQMSDKFDAPLRLKIQELNRNKQQQPFTCFIKLAQPPDEKQKSELEKDRLRLITQTNKIITAEGQPEAFIRAARHDFVISISLSQENRLLEQK